MMATADEEMRKEWILDTIDQLRKRKARPDLERICHMVERRHGRSFETTAIDLHRLVAAGIVAKVDYKGNTSYRNAAKWRKSSLSNPGTNSKDNNSRVLLAMRALTACESAAESAGGAQNGSQERSAGRAVALPEIEKWLEEKQPKENPVEYVQEDLLVAIQKEVELGRIKKVDDDKYEIIASATPKSPPTPKAKNVTPIKNKSPSNTKTNSPSPAKKGRPPGSGLKRKLSGDGTSRIKKSHGPDFESYDLVKVRRTDSEKGDRPDKSDKTEKVDRADKVDKSDKAEKGSKVEVKPEIASVPAPSPPVPAVNGDPAPVKQEPSVSAPAIALVQRPLTQGKMEHRCDFCQLTSASNRLGKPEGLLFCKDCQAKAHPSCMEYSEELARRARNSPWQCIDCKTCYVCEDSGEPDAMLFCDACDKGYHMQCHNPPIVEKPTGKWVCHQCVLELGLQEEAMETGATYTSAPNGAGCLPTPSASPVPDSGLINRDNKQNGALATNYSNGPIITLPRLADTLPVNVPDASEWTIDDVERYFRDVGFVEQAEVFREQEIDGRSLLLLKRSDVLTGLSLKLGPALKIYTHVQRLQTRGHSLH